ncbi:helix-turn-helix transcriptional regulator, partial [Holdemanella porci]|uniref:helix-turn-helix domain-containing protein n=1 Tax=Holdemanella porci TaxID=2652276 RepID=UPI002FDA9ADF
MPKSYAPEALTLDYLTNEEGQYLGRKRIRFVRQFRGLTQTELAEKSGLSADENGRIRISQYENGTRVPRK